MMEPLTDSSCSGGSVGFKPKNVSGWRAATSTSMLRLFALTCDEGSLESEETSAERREEGRRVIELPDTRFLFLKTLAAQYIFKCIDRRCCQSVWLSAAPAVLIYRQLYLVVMLFFGFFFFSRIKILFVGQRRKDWWHNLAPTWSPCLIFCALALSPFLSVRCEI